METTTITSTLLSFLSSPFLTSSGRAGEFSDVISGLISKTFRLQSDIGHQVNGATPQNFSRRMAGKTQLNAETVALQSTEPGSDGASVHPELRFFSLKMQVEAGGAAPR